LKQYAKTQLYIAGIFLFVSLFLFVTIFIYASRTIRDRQVRLLELELETTEMEVQLFFDDFSYAIEDVESFILSYGITNLLDYIIQKQDHHDSVSSIYFGTVDNVMYNSSGFIPPAGFDLRTRIWYTMAVENGGMVATPAFLNATQDYMISTIAAPVYDNGELLGVIGIDVRIEDIEEHIKGRVIGNTGFALLIDSNDNIITLPESWQGEALLPDFSETGADLSLINENVVTLNTYLHHETGAIIYTNVVFDDYELVVFMPDAEFYATQRQFGRYFIIVFIMINLIAAFFFLLNRKYIFIPLLDLDKEIGDIDVRKDIHYRLPMRDNDRFLDIKQTLNKALDTAEEYFIENAIKAEELYLRSQRFKLLIDSTQDFIIQIGVGHTISSIYGKGLSKIGLDDSMMLGKKMEEVFSQSKIAHEEMIELALKGEHKLYDWEIQKGSIRFVYETSVSPIYNQQDQILGVVSISRDITEAAIRQEEIKYINQHDYLTGLYNRRMFQETFESPHQDNHYPLTIMMLDLNGLKLINDAFGHLKGDEALKDVALTLNKILCDHFVSRIGGDEFAAILTQVDKRKVEQLADEITKAVSNLVIENVHLSISIGHEMIENKDTDFNEVIKKAENNMYRHKIAESMSVRNNAIKAIHKTLTDKYRDERIHSEKVSQLCYVIGVALGLNADSLKELRLAGMYHDIGKIAIPDAILNKPGKLTPEEFEIMKTHTEMGYNILRAADEYSKLAEYALTHHERWDGKGYPRGIKGEDIPLFARIINLADSFDAITSNRSYREKSTKDKAIEEIKKHAGHQFDPELAKIFVTQVLKREW